MKNKDINKNQSTNKHLDSSEEIEEIKIIDQGELLSDFANKLNKDESKILEELALIIKGKIRD